VPDNLRIDYNILNDAKKNLHELAGDIKPMLDHGLFQSLALDYSKSNYSTGGLYGGVGAGLEVGENVLGSRDVEGAVARLHENAKGTLGRAYDGLIELGNSFGSVGEAFLSFDAGIAQGMGITGSNLGLSNYFRDKAAWDYYQAHQSECVRPEKPHVLDPNAKVPDDDWTPPDFCHATNPGDTPPLDQVITSDRGNVHTHLTLDEHNNVVKEESTVTYDGKTYTSVTNYSNDGHTIVTDSTYPDNSTVHNETNLNPDGSGTMYTRGSDGSWSNYTRPPKDASGNQPDWVWTAGDKKPDGDSDGGSDGGGAGASDIDEHPQPPTTGGGGSYQQQ
jgi:hypothetical protein